jgi:peptidyl-prolyl cis-trans isomerase A (cyclophilin A)
MKPWILIILIFLGIQLKIAGQEAQSPAGVIIRTELGDINIKIDLDRAPATSQNFLRYIDSGLYKNSCFYRVVRMDNQPMNKIKIEVIQGGRFEDEDNGFEPVLHETTEMTGIKHTDGIISMARLEPGTATSEFFICIGDQPELDFGGKRNPDGQGFAAFGRVTGGMDVVRKIHTISAPDQYLDKPVKIYNILRAE